MLTLDELKREVDSGAIDTVVVAFTDMQGRLMGKRVHGRFFVDEGIADHGVEGCNYLQRSRHGDGSPSRVLDHRLGAGLRGLRIKPDLATLRRIP